MFVKRNIWKCDGIQLSLLFVVYSDKKKIIGQFLKFGLVVIVRW